MGHNLRDCPVCDRPLLTEEARYRAAGGDIHWECFPNYSEDGDPSEGSGAV